LWGKSSFLINIVAEQKLMKLNTKYHVVKIILFTISFFDVRVGYSQHNVNIEASPSVDKLMERFKNNGKANENVKAWRIQIITTDDRREMETAKSTFSSMYPGVNVDWKHVAPYYQVRIGFFENKNKLMPFLLELKKTFPSATPVYDIVSKRALVSN
jgi:hypothetical protein